MRGGRRTAETPSWLHSVPGAVVRAAAGAFSWMVRRCSAVMPESRACGADPSTKGRSAEAKASFVPMFAHLALVFAAGIYMPPALVSWFQNVAKLLG